MDTFKMYRILPVLVLMLTQFPGAGYLFPQRATGLPLTASTVLLKNTIFVPGHTYDDFKKIDFKLATDTDNDPYWWLINNGGSTQFYEDCGTSSCISAEHETNVKFARLQLLHDTMPVWDDQYYIGTEISEYRTLYSSQSPGRWLPTVGHPVTVSARVRFSSNYEQDGTGGAVGTDGFWLWNSYPDIESYAPVYAFGFSWTESGSAGDLDGLRMTAFQDTVPVYNEPLGISVDMSEWHEWMFEWSVDNTGEQSIQWWLDSTPVGETTLETPFQALSLTFWNDNQFPTFLEGDEYTVVMHNPASAQNFDIDWVEIEQPQ